jgi:hypothetical protein
MCDLELFALAMVLSLKWFGRAGRYLPTRQVGVPFSDTPVRGALDVAALQWRPTPLTYPKRRSGSR